MKMGRKLGYWLGSALVALAAAAPLASAASGGELDPSFGSGGHLLFPAPAGVSTLALAIAEGDDGTVFVATGSTVRAIDPGGRPDTGFAGGTLHVADPEGLQFTASDVAVDSLGRVVVFGSGAASGTTTGVSSYMPYFGPANYAVVLRYLPDGSPDPSFGGGDGAIRTDFGLTPISDDGSPLVWGGKGTVDAADRPLFVGASLMSLATCGHSALGLRDRLLARLSPAGELEARVDLWPRYGTGPAVDAGGRTFLAITRPAVAEAPCGSPVPKLSSGVTALDPAFAAAADFGSDGARWTDVPPVAIAFDDAGRLLVLGAGQGNRDERWRVPVRRYTAEGRLDRSFGRNGRVLLTPPRRFGALTQIAAGDEGRILIGGTLVQKSSSYSPKARWLTAVALRANGRVDRDVGERGWLTTRFGRSSKPELTEMLVDQEGRLLLAGYGNDPSHPGLGGLARFRLAGG